MYIVILGVHLCLMFKVVAQCSLAGVIQFGEVNYICAACKALRGPQRKPDSSAQKQIVSVTPVT